MERKGFLKLSMLLVAMVMMLFMQPGKVQATQLPTFEGTETGTLNITKKSTAKDGDGNNIVLEGVEYTLYKIANISQGKDDDGNIVLKYDSLMKDTGDNAIDVPAAVTGGDAAINTTADNLYNQINNKSTLTETAWKGTTAEDGTVSFTSLPVGVYLVYESGRPAGAAKGQSFFITIPMMNETDNGWNYTINAEPKNEITDVSLDKNIVTSDNNTTDNPSDDLLSKSQSYEIGDTVTYQIKAGVPDGIENLKYYVIEDTLSSGLTFSNAKVYGQSGSNTPVEFIANTQYKVEASGSSIKVYFLTTALENYDTIYIEITAKLNENAQIGTETGNENGVKLSYSSTTSETGIPTEPTLPEDDDKLTDVELSDDDEPVVYTYGVLLLKTNEDSDALKDVQFELLDKDGNAVYVKSSTDGTFYYLDDTSADKTNIVATNSNGQIKINGLSAGEYKLKEVLTQDGYTLLKEEISIVITATSKNPNDMEMTATVSGNSATITNGYISFTVINKKGFTLPTTGGKGIYIFTIAGLLLMATAVALMAKNKKSSK